MLTILEAIQLLQNEEVLILPTDTLYGLGALAYSKKAVKKVFDLKKRDCLKALPIHYSKIELVEKDCIITNKEMDIMKKHWPGGLTLVLKKKNSSKLKFVGDSVAVRIPGHSILLKILDKLGEPLVMPSANLANKQNIFKFDELNQYFHIEGIKDDNSLKKEPSTIISFLSGKLEVLRYGAVKL